MEIGAASVRKVVEVVNWPSRIRCIAMARLMRWDWEERAS